MRNNRHALQHYRFRAVPLRQDCRQHLYSRAARHAFVFVSLPGEYRLFCQLQICAYCSVFFLYPTADAEATLFYSSSFSTSRAFFSFPIRYRHKGQFVQLHLRTSALLPPQQSRHFWRIAFPLVILSSMFTPPSDPNRIPLTWQFFGAALILRPPPPFPLHLSLPLYLMLGLGLILLLILQLKM